MGSVVMLLRSHQGAISLLAYVVMNSVISAGRDGETGASVSCKVLVMPCDTTAPITLSNIDANTAAKSTRLYWSCELMSAIVAWQLRVRVVQERLSVCTVAAAS